MAQEIFLRIDPGGQGFRPGALGQMEEDRMTANEITAQLLIRIPQRFPQIRCWRSNTGVAIGLDSVKAALSCLARGDIAGARNYLNRRPISFGVPGSSDISGVVGPDGRVLAIEVKAGNDKIRPAQLAWSGMILSHGGIFIVARDVEQCLQALDLAIGARVT